MKHLILAGVTTRALAQSAARAGWRVTAVDAFGDLDLRDVATVVEARTGASIRFSAHAAASATRDIGADAAAYTSNFENYPDAVARLSRGRRLLGNSPDVLEQIRNPITLMRALRRRGFVVPTTRATPPGVVGGAWLRKPRRSGGGHGTVAWRGGGLPRSAYLQSRIEGTPGSISFLADGRRALPIGLSRQLVGDRAFGAGGFRYCGSMLSAPGRPIFPRETEVASVAAALASAVTDEFGLVGLNGLDFIASEGVAYPIEVNPRYSASMELVERASRSEPSLFALHEGACAGVLPPRVARPRSVWGKAIVFARRDVMVRGGRVWRRIGAADLPHAGELIRKGRPVCTVFAHADDLRRCYRQLVQAAMLVYRAVEAQARGAA
jgi:predicted ATP-grasp superfamily ATP-dependent carboligase